MMSNTTRAGLLALAILVAGLFAWPVVRTARAEQLPIPKADLRNLPVTGAAPILTSTVAGGSVAYPSMAYRVTVYVVGSDSVFNVDYGTDLAPVALNSGTALVAGRLYTFTFAATSADALNFTLTTSTTLGRLIVEEIRGGVLW